MKRTFKITSVSFIGDIAFNGTTYYKYKFTTPDTAPLIALTKSRIGSDITNIAEIEAESEPKNNQYDGEHIKVWNLNITKFHNQQQAKQEVPDALTPEKLEEFNQFIIEAFNGQPRRDWDVIIITRNQKIRYI